jgi:molybdenum cofactor cytidylyltransferase
MTVPAVAAVVLAAGGSVRLGRPKQLLAWDGVPLVRRAAEAALRSKCRQVLVVTGAQDAEVRTALAGLPLRVVRNEAWRAGVASSIRAGVGEARRGDCQAAICMVCDQAALTPAHLDRLIAAYDAGASRVASRYDGRLGVPALFARALFDELLALDGDEGARHLLRASPDVVPVDWPEGAFDVDTPADAALSPRPRG